MARTKPEHSKASSQKERLAFLEEAHRHTLESLEMAASLGVPEGVRPLGTPVQVLDETASRLKKLFKFKALAFFTIREPGGEFFLARCHPPLQASQMEQEMRLLVESGSAAWALQRKRPVFTTSSNGSDQILLHSMATASRIRGLFLGVLKQDIKTITDTSLTLGTIVLRGSASLLEGLELYGLLKQANVDLKAKVRDLEDSKKKLTREIERRVKVEEALKHPALHDPLTGLPNRALMRDRVLQAIKRSTRRDESVYAVAFVDLDKFKLVNDTLGHDSGDALLVEAGRRIHDSLRQHDTVARFGGDEFVIFLEDLTAPAEAVRILGRIRRLLATPFDIKGHVVSVTGSFGVVFGSGGQGTPEGLIKQAGTAMHAAKEAGRNRIRVFGAKLSGKVKKRGSLLAELRQAVETSRFDMLYQPLHSPDGTLTGFEAIPAWKGKGWDLMKGGALMELASREGVEWQLWLAALSKALGALSAWLPGGSAIPGLHVVMKLSRKPPPGGGLARTIREALEDAGLAGNCLRLEVPERLLSRGGEELAEQLAELHTYGVRLCAGEVAGGFLAFQAGHPGLIESMRIEAASPPQSWQEQPRPAGGSTDSLAVALRAQILSAKTCALEALPDDAPLTANQAARLVKKDDACRRVPGES